MLFNLFSENTNLRYPFFYRHLRVIEEDGWDLFSTEIEFSKLCAITQGWRISHVNSNYEVCRLVHSNYNTDNNLKVLASPKCTVYYTDKIAFIAFKANLVQLLGVTGFSTWAG